MRQDIETLANQTFDLLQIPAQKRSMTHLQVLDGFGGKGYGIPTEHMKNAVKLIAKTEGLLLDPVYSGKAISGLFNQITSQTSSFKLTGNVIFIHTGGASSLSAYPDQFPIPPPVSHVKVHTPVKSASPSAHVQAPVDHVSMSTSKSQDNINERVKELTELYNEGLMTEAELEELELLLYDRHTPSAQRAMSRL